MYLNLFENFLEGFMFDLIFFFLMVFVYCKYLNLFVELTKERVVSLVVR